MLSVRPSKEREHDECERAYLAFIERGGVVKSRLEPKQPRTRRRFANYAELLASVAPHRARRKQREAAAKGSYTQEDLDTIRERQGDRCAYCSTPLNGKGCRDHIVPLVRGGSHYPENLQWLCNRCSSIKGERAEPPPPTRQSVPRSNQEPNTRTSGKDIRRSKARRRTVVMIRLIRLPMSSSFRL